jgi:2-polyprenyl-3-methyl-5-hydroxy-6-metoxy-1,4-benzoquinol methylase
MNRILPSETDLRKHAGGQMSRSWRFRMQYEFGLFPPNDWYEVTVDRLVTKDCKWIDIGGGKSVFPYNQKLARELADRCALFVGVDPSANLDQNEFVHRRVKSTIEEFRSDETFDLATLNMVAEHLKEPELVVQSLARLIRPGGYVVIYTPNRWSLVSIAASLIPNRWHHYFRQVLWQAKKEDTFPTYYKMNTRTRLRALFDDGGFSEAAFTYLEACGVVQRFRSTYFLELSLWRMFHILRIRYPLNALLGVYQKKLEQEQDKC